MAAVQIGTAIVWGIPTVTSLKTGSTEANALAATARALVVTGVSVSESRQVDETLDADGDISAVVMYGQSKEAQVECFPTASTIADAKTANALPAVGDVIQVVLSSATEDIDFGTTSGGTYWTITGASKNRSNTAKATWTLTLKKWGGISSQSQL